uniref:Piezo-type mechanosensitive ion channel component 2 n=2 Tax=Sipha flava TaxID=143950 RepID=A0A2S2RAB8_9HEMI
MILFVIFWTGTKNVDIFSLGYLCAGTILFWKGIYYYIMPPTSIIKLWNWFLDYSILVIFFKVFFHLFGCLVFSYFHWNSCILIRILSMFCPRRTSEEDQGKLNLLKI